MWVKYGLDKFWFALVLVIVWFSIKYVDHATILIVPKFSKIH